MTPASRRKAWWGLGLILVLVILGGFYFVRLSAPAVRPAKAEGPLLCLAQEPQFHQGGAGQGPRRQ